MVSREIITYLCRLSQLELSEEELVKYEIQLEEIIKYLDKLDGATFSDVGPILLERNSDQLREDNAKSFEFDALGNIKNRKGSFVKGPLIP
jgi:aspartyl/glutamyl-tRNA(Asn/Gln) amidotransferase C subunit